MKIIISPAKKMRVDTDTFLPETEPALLGKTRILMERMRGFSLEEARDVWKCNEKLAVQNYERFQKMDLESGLTPALIAYEGIQYQYMAPMTFEREEWDYVSRRLRILSGFYGILRPFDGVAPYRLEMQTRLCVGGHGDLYGFWGDGLYRELMRQEREEDGGDGSPVIVNLASKEYSQCIENYLEEDVRLVTCVFGEKRDGKVRQKTTQAKMARGEMVRFMAKNRVSRPEELKAFDGLGFFYSPEDSDEGPGQRIVYTFCAGNE